MKKNRRLTLPKLPSNGSQSTILKWVRDLSPVSRSRLSESCGMPRPPVTRTVAALMEKDLLIELPLADTSGQRRSNGLSLNPVAGYCLSIKYGATGIQGIIMDTAYNTLVHKEQLGNWVSMTQQERLGSIISFIEYLQQQAPPSNGPCLGIAVVDCGIIDRNMGVSLDASTIKNWHNVPIVKTLEERFNLPIFLLNDSHSFICAVDRLELQGSIDDVLYIQYDEGIGCCIKTGGQYVIGHADLAGEFGHLKVTTKNIQCRCGGTGCLESLAALPALVENVNTAIDNGSKSTLTSQPHFDGYDVLKAAKTGDRLAVRVVHEAFTCLAEAVGGLINILDPKLVLFQDTVQLAGDNLVSTLCLETCRNALPAHGKHIEVRISKMPSYIGSLGGAVAILDYCLEF